MLRAGALSWFPFWRQIEFGWGGGVPRLADGTPGGGTEVTLLILLTLLTEGADRADGGAGAVKTSLLGRGRCGRVWVLCWICEKPAKNLIRLRSGFGWVVGARGGLLRKGWALVV